jgi:hypothetical protein
MMAFAKYRFTATRTGTWISSHDAHRTWPGMAEPETEMFRANAGLTKLDIAG